MENVSEKLITDVAFFISELTPVNLEQVKNKLSTILVDYHVTKVESEEVHPDLYDKIKFYLGAKKLEGLSEATLKGYELELNLFANTRVD
ncbi:hypothetical protein P5663_07040 [Priestia flexa]|uniref:hypothetical protein n=1 Tax=Priestia flexa TaxID=86664 RepID=UPI00240DA458|nr:hypothetical protein [Priestia flexa]WEZ09590.1 hypothetical protein P5663_07040 [Priestia flexa]